MNANPSDWLFDLGNTRLKCAPLVDGRCGEVIALAHGEAGFVEKLDALLPQRGGVAHLASVAPQALTVDLLDRLATRFARIDIARTQASCAGVRIAYADPSKLGVDRFLALLAAHAHGDAALVVGVGTAVTIDLIDANGQHHGGRIAPSPSLMREALHARAAVLPIAGGIRIPFAADTTDALASGCEGAVLALIADSLAAARERLGIAPALLLHGGGADALQSALPHSLSTPSLVLQGLACWARLEVEPA
ncbi:type III pantothenate kinase [Pseudoluteimonas lycopersici]|uniref:Type III pantothenate kinase n=1 Tax=Pseudoluteimonas lycopersici TaxID=1324796 RepID=A0A516V781_9GAMM|nr:type III pantothenate kinase [Lysobacter lycopersici]QDQ74361.1 type III pantothenate kinase [Lysobacter lycopersici]